MSRTVHVVRARRSGRWWALDVPEVPGAHSQVKRLDQAEDAIREAIALVLDYRPTSFDVEVRPELPEEQQEAAEVARVRSAELRRAEKEASDATRRAVQTLTKRGLTVRDTGWVLGLSPQRVSQIAAGRSKIRATSKKAKSPGAKVAANG